MELRIRLFAGLRERAGQDEFVARDLPQPLDVAGLKVWLREHHPELGEIDHVRGVLGTRYVPDDTPIDGSEPLSLLPPVSGGNAEPDAELELGRFEVCAEPLDPGACLTRVGHPSCGGGVLFTGTTRATNRGREVVQLDYEAFEAMAGTEMERIFQRCRETFGPEAHDGDPEFRLRMLCQHRTGTVGVGEPSVVIAVASPHRDAAFGAARFLIDELKASVPLWKRECYADGHHWIGERS